MPLGEGFITAGPNPRALLEIVRRVQDYLRSLVEALNDLCLRARTECW